METRLRATVTAPALHADAALRTLAVAVTAPALACTYKSVWVERPTYVDADYMDADYVGAT